MKGIYKKSSSIDVDAILEDCPIPGNYYFLKKNLNAPRPTF